jgi:hypothetical protein
VWQVDLAIASRYRLASGFEADAVGAVARAFGLPFVDAIAVVSFGFSPATY